MDFTLSKQQLMAQKMYREFAENEVKPLAKQVDAEEYFPKETVEKMGKLGMMGIYFPTSVGGAGGDVLSYVMAVEEMSKVCGTTGVILSAHTSLCAAPIYENGTPEQKAKYLPKLCSGEWLGAFGLTEPGAGTDAQGQQTFAEEREDGWLLNGSKIFITNAGYADVFIIIAVTGTVVDKRGRKSKEISAFIVERTDPGFKVGKPEDKMGIRGSSTCELIMEDCLIPKDRLLGVKGRGFQLAMGTLDGGRIGIAAQALGIAEGAIDETVAYVKERKHPVPEHPVRAGRDEGPRGRRQVPGLRRRPEEAGGHERPEGPLQRRGRRGQADRLPHGQRRHPPLPAALWRLRLYPRLSDRADDARRQDHRDLRGHQRGADDGHLGRAAEVRRAMLQ